MFDTSEEVRQERPRTVTCRPVSSPVRVAPRVLCLIASLGLPFFPQRLPAQDSLRPSSRDILREITSYRETDAAVIAKGRSLLLDCVRAGDVAKGVPAISFLRTQYAGTRYIPLLPSEEFLLLYWASDFDDILNPSALETIDSSVSEGSIEPPRDFLFDDLLAALRPRREALMTAVVRAPLRMDESEFLQMFLVWLLNDPQDADAQNRLNDEAGGFLARFGDSPYASFVRSHIRLEYEESRLGCGFTIGLGGGSFGGNLGTLFKAAGAFDLGFDLGLKQALGDHDGVFYARLTAGLGGKVRTPFAYHGDWEEGAKEEILIPEVSVGLVTIKSDLVNVVPFAGVSGIFFTPPTDENGNSTSSLKLSLFSWSAGLNADWKIGTGDAILAGSYIFIRTRVTFTVPFNQSEVRFTGNIFTFTADFGLFGYGSLRDL